jgi:signal recognition particle receptor subunit alpha
MFIPSDQKFNRSGAVEQLRVHVRNLSMLGVSGAGDSKGRVELFERGYGKDAAGIAREAINYGMKMLNDIYLAGLYFLFSVRP